MRSPLIKGVLIVFEGIDGTGKSTQLNLLAQHLSSSGYPVITTREPTEGIYGQKIRQLYANRDKVTKQEELQLFLDDRREHVEKLLTPALNNKKIVLCDRYFLSTVAYQGAAGFNPDEILHLNSFAPDPNLALIFQATPESSIERITQLRGDTPNDFEKADTLTKVAAIFDKLDFQYIHRIDANDSIAAIHSIVVRRVESLLQSLQQKSST